MSKKIWRGAVPTARSVRREQAAHSQEQPSYWGQSANRTSAFFCCTSNPSPGSSPTISRGTGPIPASPSIAPTRLPRVIARFRSRGFCQSNGAHALQHPSPHAEVLSAYPVTQSLGRDSFRCPLRLPPPSHLAAVIHCRPRIRMTASSAHRVLRVPRGDRPEWAPTNLWTRPNRTGVRLLKPHRFSGAILEEPAAPKLNAVRLEQHR